MKDVHQNLFEIRKKFEDMLEEQRRKRIIDKAGSSLNARHSISISPDSNMIFFQETESWVLMLSIMKGIERSITRITPKELIITEKNFKEKDIYYMTIK